MTVTFSSELAEIRFGCGLSPVVAAPSSVMDMLDGLNGPDDMARRFPITPFSDYSPRIGEFRDIRIRQRRLDNPEAALKLQDQARQLSRAARADMAGWYARHLLRCSQTATGLRERLQVFWSDHFTTVGKTSLFQFAGSPFEEEVIRPRMAGKFADLLIAVTTHPMMLQFLDQQGSAGPNSPLAMGRKRKGGGLNENLAREVLELHTLGVDGGYSQTDVRELAKLFTGMTMTKAGQFKFDARMIEPGAETVLGQSYGQTEIGVDAIHAVLRDLAAHPSTARHLARKLAVHFVSDTPDAALVDHLATRYSDSGGDLMAVYAALLTHPSAWVPGLRNVKPPQAYVASACRALALTPDMIAGFAPREIMRSIMVPTRLMGQPWQRASGPDGFTEEDTAWITPQGLSARVRWAMTVPARLRADLPDPRGFVDQALGGFATDPVRFAASAAETRADAIGLVLSSPAFQRR